VSKDAWAQRKKEGAGASAKKREREAFPERGCSERGRRYERLNDGSPTGPIRRKGGKVSNMGRKESGENI